MFAPLHPSQRCRHVRARVRDTHTLSALVAKRDRLRRSSFFSEFPAEDYLALTFIDNFHPKSMDEIIVPRTIIMVRLGLVDREVAKTLTFVRSYGADAVANKWLRLVNNTPDMTFEKMGTLIYILQGLQCIYGLEDALLRVDALGRILRAFWEFNQSKDASPSLSQMGALACMIITGMHAYVGGSMRQNTAHNTYFLAGS